MEILNQPKTESKKEKNKEKEKEDNEKVKSEEQAVKQSEIIQPIDPELKTEDNKEKNDDISNSLELKYSIKTYYDIYDIFKNATFFNDDYWTISKTPTKNKENSIETTSITIDIYKDELVGKFKEIDEKEQKEKTGNDDVNKYDKIFFMIKYQKYISLINYKLNNGINLNDVEKNVIKYLIEKENNNDIILNETKSESDNKIIKEYESKRLTIPNIFYDDIEKIKKKGVADLDDQIKFDIYNQMKKNENQTQYEKELKVVYNYFIYQYYNEISLNIALTNDGKECVEEKVVEKKKISSKKTLLYC